MTSIPKKAKLKSGDKSIIVSKKMEETAFSGDSEEESDVDMEANFALLTKNRTAVGEEEEGGEGSASSGEEESGEGSGEEEEDQVEGSDEEEEELGEGSDEEEQGEGSDEDEDDDDDDDESESSDGDDESGETKELDTGGNTHTEKDVKEGELRS